MKDELEFTTKWNSTEYTFDLYFDRDGYSIEESSLVISYNGIDITGIIDNALWERCLEYAEDDLRSRLSQKYQGEYD